jgi:hypothetical protein
LDCRNKETKFFLFSFFSCIFFHHFLLHSTSLLLMSGVEKYRATLCTKWINVGMLALLGCYAASIGSYQNLGQPIGPIFNGKAVQETSVTIALYCVTSQKSKYLIYKKVEAWNHELPLLCNLPGMEFI